jgi:hypothetical protein
LSKHEYSKDFVAFLRSPLTQKIEFEIRITAEPTLIQEYEKLLKQKEIVYRKSPIDVFPPPRSIIIEDSVISDCLGVLLAWYARNKDKNIIVRVVGGAGDITDVNSKHDIEKLIKLNQSKK